MDDRALSRALVAGDARAFHILVERETTRVFRTCYRILGRVDEAEEATQDTFVLAYRALGSFRGDGHPAAWLTRIATRECWRRASRSARLRAATTILDERAMTLPANAADPLGSLVSTEERELVRAAVARLPEPYREVISLRFFGELSIGEIAALTGRPSGTVKAHVHRGLARLRKLLAEAAR